MEYKRLGDIATYINGYPFKPEDRGTTGLPIIRIQDLTGNAYDTGFYDGDYPERIEINDGDVLISWSASLGIYIWNKGKALLNQHIFKVAFDKCAVNKQYFVYAVQHKLQEMEAKTHGATMKHIVKKDFDNTVIPFPAFEEQEKISQIMNHASGIISARQQELQKLDELVKARFVELFGDPVASENKRKLSEIGRIFTGNTPSMKEPSYYESNDIPFIKPSDLNESGVTNIEGVEAYISEKARPVARIIPPNAVLVTCIGTIGKIGITSRESCCNQQINFVVPNDGINSLYLAYCLTFFKSTLQNIANAPVVPIINKTQFSELEVPVFDIDKQNQFAAFVEQTDKSKVVVQKALDEAQLLFDSLMQKYFG